MAEIEHYVDPLDKSHAGFADVKDTKIKLLAKDIQLSGKTTIQEMTVGEAVEKKIIDNETLGYFIARIYQFLIKIGIKDEKLRFRQHMDNEMAHYACDCWDAEIQTSYVSRREKNEVYLSVAGGDSPVSIQGWIECVGCADRSAYDLTVHSVRTKEKLVVREQLAEPVKVERWQLEINKKTFGPKFKKDAKAVEESMLANTDECFERLAKDLETTGVSKVEANGTTYEVSKDDVKVERVTVTEHGKYIYIHIYSLKNIRLTWSSP